MKMCKSLLLTLAAVLALAARCQAATPPGEPAEQNTEGKVLVDYLWQASVMTYANATAQDVKDIITAMDQKNGPDYATAKAIYTLGKNSFRSFTPPVAYRIMKGVFTANYGVTVNATGFKNRPFPEPYWALAMAYYNNPNDTYGNDNPIYMDTWITAALDGTGEFASACCGVRAETVKALTNYYPYLYFYHEADAAGNALEPNPPARGVDIEGAQVEVDDAWGCYVAPDYRGNGKITGNKQRVAPGFNAWDKCNEYAKAFCLSVRGGLSPTNAKLLALQKTLQAETNRDPPNPNTYRAIRLEMQTYMTYTMIQQTLLHAYEAAQQANQKPKPSSCTRACGQKSELAGAWATWRAIAPAVEALQPLSTDRSAIVAIEARLNPASSSTFTKNDYAQLVQTIRGLVGNSANFDTYIARCKTN